MAINIRIRVLTKYIVLISILATAPNYCLSSLIAMNSKIISQINPFAGQEAFLAFSGIGTFDGALAYGDGKLFALNHSSIYAYDPITGKETFVSSMGADSHGAGLVFIQKIAEPPIFSIFILGASWLLFWQTKKGRKLKISERSNLGG